MEFRLRPKWYQCQFCDEVAIVKDEDVSPQGHVWCHCCHHMMKELDDSEQEDRYYFSLRN